MNYFIDCEFDGHNEQLLTFACIREDDDTGLYVRVNALARDPWVLKNVVPIIGKAPVPALLVGTSQVGPTLLKYICDDQNPTIIADSPVDIARFCHAITTTKNGTWQSVDRSYSFVAADVDIGEYFDHAHAVDGENRYPTRHNAWWDAYALKLMLADG